MKIVFGRPKTIQKDDSTQINLCIKVDHPLTSCCEAGSYITGRHEWDAEKGNKTRLPTLKSSIVLAIEQVAKDHALSLTTYQIAKGKVRLQLHAALGTSPGRILDQFKNELDNKD